jgi:hypothetical protein
VTEVIVNRYAGGGKVWNPYAKRRQEETELAGDTDTALYFISSTIGLFSMVLLGTFTVMILSNHFGWSYRTSKLYGDNLSVGFNYHPLWASISCLVVSFISVVASFVIFNKLFRIRSKNRAKGLVIKYKVPSIRTVMTVLILFSVTIVGAGVNLLPIKQDGIRDKAVISVEEWTKSRGVAFSHSQATELINFAQNAKPVLEKHYLKSFLVQGEKVNVDLSKERTGEFKFYLDTPKGNQ